MTYSNAPLRIVMVDDDKDDIFLTRMAFKRADLTSIFMGLESGKDLFDYIKNNGIGSIDLLLLDLNMPVQDGHAILKELADYPHFKELCTVMFSTSRRVVDKEVSKNLGATAFIVKPSTAPETDAFVKNVSEIVRSREYAVAC